MQADNSRLKSKVEELSTQVELQQRRVAEVEAALKVEERRAREARAALDRKRQKKRGHKATAIKFQQLWQKVQLPRCMLEELVYALSLSLPCDVLCSRCRTLAQITQSCAEPCMLTKHMAWDTFIHSNLCAV